MSASSGDSRDLESPGRLIKNIHYSPVPQHTKIPIQIGSISENAILCSFMLSYHI